MKKVLIYALILLHVFSSVTTAAIFIDNDSGCSNGATNYDPATRTCGAGSDTVYTTFSNAHTGVSAGTQGSPTVINVRAGVAYSMATLNITKDWLTFQKYSGDGSQPSITGSASEWYGKFQIYSDGITIDNLDITGKSNAGGVIQAGDGSSPSATTAYLTVKNCTIHNIYGEAVMLWWSDNATIEYNEIYRTQEGNISPYSNEWGGALYAVGCDTVAIEYNEIYNGGGEGMNFNRNSSNFTIRYNTMWNHKAPAIFINGVEHVVVAFNLVYHTGDSTYKANSYGIVIGAENWGYPGYYANTWDALIYGNFIAGHYNALSIAEVGSGQQVYSAHFFNNTVVEPFTGTYGHALYFESEPGAIGSSVDAFNNLFIQSASSEEIANVPSSGITYGNNAWSKAPVSAARDSSDPQYAGYSSFAVADYLSKTSGWTSITPGALATSDFNLTGTATYAINEGRVISGYYTAPVNIGAYQSSTGLTLSDTFPTAQQVCVSNPETVTMGGVTSANSNCRYSTNAAHTTYAAMSNQFTTGEGSVLHMVNVSQACGGSTPYYMICNDGTNDSNREMILIDVEAAGGGTAPPANIKFGKGASNGKFSINGIIIH